MPAAVGIVHDQYLSAAAAGSLLCQCVCDVQTACLTKFAAAICKKVAVISWHCYDNTCRCMLWNECLGRQGTQGASLLPLFVAVQAARAVRLTGPGIYFGDLVRLCIFYWAIVSDALLLKVCKVKATVVQLTSTVVCSSQQKQPLCSSAQPAMQ